MLATGSREEVTRLLTLLTDEERVQLDVLLRADAAIWRPLPGPQATAYHSQADELFYGGAGGGGKTDLILGLAGTAHRKSIIFRREFPQLREIEERSRALFEPHGRFNANLHLWRLNDGRLVELGAMQHAKDMEDYRGRPHDLKAFDEITAFTELQYRFVIGWNRTTYPGQRCRVVSVGNPPSNAEGEWVIRYWGAWLDEQHSRPAAPGELRWYAMVEGKEVECEDGMPFVRKGETIQPRSRTYVPARLADNPYLLNTGYLSVLQALPEPLRSQMLNGDFHAGVEDDPWQVVPTAWVEAAMARWRADGKPNGPMTAVGVDVARGGKDKTALAPRWGYWFEELEIYPGTATPDGSTTAAHVERVLLQGGYANVDVIGVGASTYDILRRDKQDARAINFAEGTEALDRSGKLRFANVRAAAYWKMREALDPERGDNLALPPSRTLKADLCAPRWSMRPSGILVEPKEDVAERLGRSPDEGDAVVLADYIPPRKPKGAFSAGGGVKGW